MSINYRSRIKTPQKVLSVVKSGQRVYVHNVQEPSRGRPAAVGRRNRCSGRW